MWMAAAAQHETLSDVDVECTQCGVRMSARLGSGGKVKYFRCGSCHRWVSSTYAEILRADAKVRMRRPCDDEAEDEAFAKVKDRLERWLASLDDQDPYRLLGVSPFDSSETVRERYRELAFATHPDRGGSVDRMRQLNVAYERILRHREGRPAGALPSGTAVRREASLPMRSR
jgi:hypothetical protein